jgi:hypothetical protein
MDGWIDWLIDWLIGRLVGWKKKKAGHHRRLTNILHTDAPCSSTWILHSTIQYYIVSPTPSWCVVYPSVHPPSSMMTLTVKIRHDTIREGIVSWSSPLVVRPSDCPSLYSSLSSVSNDWELWKVTDNSPLPVLYCAVQHSTLLCTVYRKANRCPSADYCSQHRLCI